VVLVRHAVEMAQAGQVQVLLAETLRQIVEVVAEVLFTLVRGQGKVAMVGVG
jgi:hypothetical protein